MQFLVQMPARGLRQEASPADASFSAMLPCVALREGREAKQHPRCPRPAVVLFYAMIEKTSSDPWCILLGHG